ncbi:MAG TPA: glycosyltransferase family 4 protein [Anaerolineaceae bacterium]|nr:glycosyltransferase family 4 protein [Anaerolineaceae bacterium]
MPESLRILMITHHRTQRTRPRARVMAQHLIQRGHQVVLLTTADTRRGGIQTRVIDEVPVVEFPDLLWGRLRSGWDLWALLNRLAWLRRAGQGWDLIHCFETRPNTIHPALDFARRSRIPLVTDWNDWIGRGGLLQVLRPAWYRLLLGWLETYYEEHFRSRADGTTVICSALGRRAENLGIPPERICRIPGGTSPDLYPAYAKEACRARLGYDLTEPLLGFASADSHLDVGLMFAALAQVAQRFPTVRLICTGTVRPEVHEAARRAGVADRLILPGFLPLAELPWQLGCADVFLLPYPQTVYNLGRWPNKIGLYLCLGRPVVTNPTGDLAEVLARHPVGLTVGETPADFAAGICTLLADPDLAGRMGAAARQAAVADFNWRTLIIDLEQFYQRILATRRTT